MHHLQMLRAALAVGTALVAVGLPAFADIRPSPVVAVQSAARPVAQPVPAKSFLKIDGIPGESVDSAHPAWIEITSFQWGTPSTSVAGRATSREGRSAITSLTFTKPSDKTSPVLQKAGGEGKHFKTAVLEFVSHAKSEHYQIKMSDVIVSSFKLGASPNDERPTESVSLNFAKVEIKYGKLDAQGSKGPLTTPPPEWDIRMAVPN